MDRRGGLAPESLGLTLLSLEIGRGNRIFQADIAFCSRVLEGNAVWGLPILPGLQNKVRTHRHHHRKTGTVALVFA